MKERVLKLLSEAMPNIDFAGNDHLVDEGILDSLSIITLISELSMEFGVNFDMGQIDAEHFNSIDSIVETILQLQEEN